MNLSALSIENYIASHQEITEQLQNPSRWNEIPFLNHSNQNCLRDLTLVRFRGMIQDMMDTEIYLEKYEVLAENGESRLQDGRYRDTLALRPGETIAHNSSKNVHGERRTLFVVSTPGINQWAIEMEQKLGRMVVEQWNEEADVERGEKRPLEDGGEAMEAEGESQKRSSGEEDEVKASNCVLSAEYLLNSPIPDRPGKACLVKIYADFEAHSLNSLVDVVGFLSVDPALDGSCVEMEDEFDEPAERQAANPPPSLIPRVHAIHVRKLSHANPLLEVPEVVPEDQSVAELSKDLHLTLSQCLLGDELAAEYLLCHLISSVYIRNDMQSLGKFSLNISQIPVAVLPEFTELLYEVIELLLPASHYFPMTLDNMNSIQFMPKKDYKTNKLTSGLLQLAPHTHLVLDETRLQQGKLEAAGVQAVQHLAALINTQTLKYDFQFYQLEFDVDIPVLILSEGRSMLPHDCHLPLRPDPDAVPLFKETFAAVRHFLRPRLNALRAHLTRCKVAKFAMGVDDNSEMVQLDFVEMRRDDPAVSAQHLHDLLVLTRLVGLGGGRTALDRDTWQRARRMEAERKERVEALGRHRNEA